MSEERSSMENVTLPKSRKTSEEMCTSRWYKDLHLEFGAFSVNNFEKVMFLMDDSYRDVIRYRHYRCIFFRYGKIFSRNDVSKRIVWKFD